MSATIKDIAKLSGVSKSTVSRVLSNSGIFSREAKEKVEQSAKALNYQPNSLARAMITRKTGNLGFVIYHKHKPVLSHPFYSPILSSVVETAAIYNYGMLIFTDRDIQNAYKSIREKRLDGVILASRIDKDVLLQFQLQNIPVVLVNHSADVENMTFIKNDDYGGAYDAMQFLLSKGYTRIGIICGPREHRSFKLRYDAYCAALRSRGITYDETLVQEGESNLSGGKEGIIALMKLPNMPKAIFASNDMMAIGAIKELKARGFSVPRDVAVIGFDDIEFSALYEPALTTVRVNKEQIGELAVRQLIRQIQGKQKERKQVEEIVLPASLIIRDSV